MDDLFDVFDEAPQTAPPKIEEIKEDIPASTTTSNKKRSREFDEQSKQESKTNNIKKTKKHEDIKPVVFDSVEIETSREVKASEGLLSKPSTSDADNKLKLRHQVRHQVAIPPSYPYIPIGEHKRKEDARTYPFVLDPFQDTAISCIDRNESVLVSAHTSAGKTVVAEYAIAQSLRDKQRVIYTSPIKALSNQKYRELQAIFGDVGLMTGDVTINPDAGCLVMTTEILRSMLYRGSEVMREVAWVIFDEVHYMRDKSRGVVWEETIILLPDKVHYVFLSATIPNAMEFAEWIVKIHNQPCHVVYTDFRPTPLQHYLFPAGGDGIHLVVDEKGTFREENFQKAMATIGDNTGEDPASADKSRNGKKGKTFKGGNKDGKSDIYKIVKMIYMKKYNPVIVFSFSKRECESLALKMSKLDFNTDEEREALVKIFNNAIELLPENDRELPQIKNILPLLKRGIGIHHSGLLPILKEIIEILFQEGFLKVLFATETFSIGLNMPAKTVVFTSVRKWDGVGFRWVSGGEYIQMSGRAGRRGLDDRGIVIMMIDEKMEPQVAKGMVKGQADRLDSAFHLGYNMIVNLMRVEGISPEFMLENSFFQFQKAASVPVMEDKMLTYKKELEDIHINDEGIIKEYYELQQQLDKYNSDVQKVITHPGNSLPFLQDGRVIKVKIGNQDYGWGMVTTFVKRNRKSQQEEFTPHEAYVVEVFITSMFIDSPVNLIKKFNPLLPEGIRPAKSGEQTRAEFISITLDSIEKISTVRLRVPDDYKSSTAKRTFVKTLKDLPKKLPDGIPLIDPVGSMKITDEDFKKLLNKIDILESKISANPLHNSARLKDLYEQYSYKVKLETQIKQLKEKIFQAEAVVQLEQLGNMKRVLKKLELTGPNDIVELKGRVAAEISTGDELMITELLFSGFFNDLTPQQICGLLSCFIFQERAKELPKLKPELAEPAKFIHETASKIAKISKNCNLEIVEKDYVESFNLALVEVVFAWSNNASFSSICKMTDIYEGSIIRALRREIELLKQLVDAAKIIGNQELVDKFDKCTELLNRDFVQVSSLYM